MTTKNNDSWLLLLLAVLGLAGTANAQLTIAPGSGSGTFSPGPIQIPLIATGGTGTGQTWSIDAGSLPAGLSLRSDGKPSFFPSNATAGIIGVATTAGPASNFTLRVTDSGSNTTTLACNLKVIPLAVTDPNPISDGFINVPYSYTPATSGAVGSVTWALQGGNSLPPGLSLNTSTGQISGTPTTAGNFGFGLRVTDTNGTIGRFFNIQVWGVGFSGSADLGTFNQGSVVNVILNGSGGTAPYTFAGGGLPQGLTLSAAGQLSGTLTGGNGTFRFNVTVTDSRTASYNKNFVLNIIGTPTLPNMNYPNSPEDATLGEPRTYPFNVNGGKGPYTWTISLGSLPPGMRLQTTNLPTYLGPDDAVIQGSATQLGTFNFSVSVQDSSPIPVTVTQPMTLQVKATTHDYPSNPTRGSAYSFYIRPIGGSGPYTYSILSGNLPGGLTLDSSTGIVAGTPTENGFGNFTVKINIGGATETIQRYIGFNVNSPTNPQISINGQKAMGDASVNSPYNYQFNACCTPTGMTFSLVGLAPAGLTLNSNGQLSGTPTAVGQYTLEIHAVDNGNGANLGVRFFTLNVSPLQPNTPTPNAIAGTPYTTTFTATGGAGLNWVFSQLPPGMKSVNGTISGTPTSPGSYNLTYTVSDNLGRSYNGNFGLQVYPSGSIPPPSIAMGSNFGTWTQGEIQNAFNASGGNGTYTWSLAGGALPIGLSIRTDVPSFFQANQQAGAIGLATTPGNYSFTLAVSSAGQSAYLYCTWRITPLTLKDGGMPPAFAGVPYTYTFTALNGAGAVTWAPNGAMPPGMSISSGGTFSGTPTQAGNFNFNFSFTDGNDTVFRGFNLNVSAVRFTTSGVLPNVSQGGAINVTFAASGGAGGYTFAPNGLPGGLSLSPGGNLTGTANMPVGRTNFSVTVTDSNSASYSKTFSLDVVGLPPQLPSIQLNNLIFNPLVSLGVYTSRLASVTGGGTAPFTWAVSGLPPGLSARLYDVSPRTDLIPDDVEIWGTATATGTYSVQYTVNDANGLSSTLSFPMTVSVLTVDGADYLPNGTVGVPYSKKLRVLGGAGPYTVSSVNPLFNTFPAGVTLDSGTFLASGTPQENGSFFPTLQFDDSAGHSLQVSYGFNINSATSSNININQSSFLGSAIVNTPYSFQLSACCVNGGSFTWTLVGGALPTGVTLSATGQLLGTPTVPAAYTFLVKAADSNNLSNAGFRQFVLNVTPLALSTGLTLPFGNVSIAYSTTIVATGGTGAISFTLGVGGPLPPGLSLNATNGVISGTPTATGIFTFTVNIADSGGHITLGFFKLPIYTTNGGPAVAITTAADLGTFPIGEIQQQLVANGGTGAFSWSLTSGSLPPGLSLRTDKPGFFPSTASAGIIGVATAPQAAPYQFTLTAASGNQSASQAFTMKITGLTSMENTGYRPADAFVATPYTYTFTALNAAGTVTFGSPNNLPPGLTLSSAGVLSGTPTTANFYNVSFTINDTVDTVTIFASLNVTAVKITSPGLMPNATQGAPYAFTFAASGGTGPYTYTSNSLPNGLTLSPAGVVSGTVTAGPGRWGFNLTATDVNNVSYTKNMALVIIGVPPALPFIQPYGNLDDCSFGITCSRGLAVINGGAAPFAWIVTGLPPGMGFRSGSGITTGSINPTDVELWGAPQALGTFNVKAVVTDNDGKSATQTVPLRVSALFVDGSDYLPGGTRGVAYSRVMRVVGGTPAAGAPLYGTQLVLGVLPAGLSLNGMTVSGTPLENGGFSPGFIFTDSAARTLHLTEGFGIGSASTTINANQTAFGNTGSNNNILGYFTVNTNINNLQLFACCAPSYSWSLIGGTLPTGLSLTSSGVLQGTMTATGVYTFLVQVADAGNLTNFGVRQYTIIVTGVSISPVGTLPFATLNQPYSTQLVATPAATFSVPPDYYLPPGLTVSGSGLISGTPTTTGQYVFYLLAVDANNSNNVVARQFTLSVYTDFPPLFLGTGPTLGPFSPGSHTQQLTATGGKPPYRYSFSPGAPAVPGYRVLDGGQLPNNFNVASGTGGLVGVSTGPGTFPTSLRVTDSNGSTYDRAITLINSSLTVLNPNSPPAAVINAPYSYTYKAFGGTGTYSWTASGLPAGLTISNSQGTVSGTPTVSGNFGFTVIVTDTAGITEPFGYTLTVFPFAIATGQVLPQGTVNSAYSQTLSAPNCGTGCNWSIASGSLPGGMSLSSAGLISGTPTGSFNSTFTVQANGSNGTSQRVFALLVPFTTPQPLFITQNPNLFTTTVGNGFSTSLFVQGGTPPYTWSIANGSSLPPGISLETPGETLAFNFQAGFPYLFGKPMQVGTYPFTLKVTDGASNTTTQAFNWVITPLNNNMNNFPVGGAAGTYGAATPTPAYGTPYSQQLLILGGSGNYISWTTPLAANPLPPGLTLNSATGVVSGTPAATGFFSTLVQVLDDTGNTLQQFINFNVASPSGTAVNFGLGNNLGSFTYGVFRVFNLNPNGGTGPYTITALDPLPPGCSIVTGNSLLGNAQGSYDLYCTPLSFGPFTFRLMATDSLGNIGVRQYNVNFGPQQIFTNMSLPNGSVSTAYSQELIAFDNVGTVTWSIPPGFALPPGLTLSGSFITGAPTAAGTYSFTLTATDSNTSVGVNFGFSLVISNITITNPSIIPVVAVFDTPFSYQFTATGGGSKTWSATGVPNGLTMSAGGLLGGTMKSTGSTFNLLVTVTDGVSPVTKRIALFSRNTTPALLSISPSATLLADARVGQAYTASIAPFGGTPPYTWTLAGGSSLPPGLALYSGSSLPSNILPGATLIGGEPTTPDQYSFDLIATDAAAATVRCTFTLNVTPIAIQTGGLPSATINVAYSRQLITVGGAGPYTYTYRQASLNTPMFPPGIAGSPSGLISGTPTSTGFYPFFVTAADGAGHTFTIGNSLIVTNTAGMFVNSVPFFAPTIGDGVQTTLFTNQNSTYTWSVVAGALPANLTLSQGGVLEGPLQPPGNYNFTVRATDTQNPGNFADRQYTGQVAAIGVDFGSGTMPTATVGTAYSYALKAVGGTGPYTFATTPLSPLPPGLTLSSTGLLSGTPTQTGAFNFTMLLSDSSGYNTFDSTPTIFVVNPGQNVPIFVDNTGTPDGAVGVAYAVSLGQGFLRGGNTGGVKPISWSVAPGSSLPPGMTLLPGSNGVSAYLGGIPTTAGTYTYTLLATDAVGQQGLTQNSTTIQQIAVSPKLMPSATVGAPYSLAFTASGGTPPYTFQRFPGSGLATGFTFSSSGVLSGNSPILSPMNLAFSVIDSSLPAPKTLTFAEYFGTVDQGGTLQTLGMTPLDVVQLSYVRTGPAPAPVPINITVSSGTVPFTAMVSGLPGVSLSAPAGTAPATLTLSLDPTGLTAGVYAGVIAAYAPNATFGFTGVPAVLTVIDPPPCTFTLNPTGGAIPAAGGSGSFNVSTGSLCSWTAIASDPFIAIVPATASGTGPGTVQYSLGPNGGLAPRPGSIAVGGQQYNITQFGSACALAINPSTTTATYSGGLATVNVTTTNPACSWTATGLGAAPANGTGNKAVTFTIPPTNSVATQTLTATVQLTTPGSPAAFTVTQTGILCTVALSASSAGINYSGGSGAVNVTTPAGCSYNVVSGPSWISVTSGASGNGPGPVALTYSVAANSNTVSRTGSLTIGDRNFTITQDPTPCSVTVDAANSGSPFGSPGGSGTLAITANGANCTWTASSPVSWATVAPAFGTGNGTINVTATSNVLSTTSRTANLTVAGQSVAVTQGGTICTYTLGSASSTIPFGGGTGSVSVTAPAACTWSSAQDNTAAWLTISSSGSGGTSNVVFTATPNPTATARSGTLTIAGQPFTVNEAAGPCNYILSGANTTLAAGLSGGLFTFSTGTAGCSATPISFASWLTATANSSADGTSGTVNFTATANPAGVTRTGTIQFAGQTFSVAQSGAACSYSLNRFGLALTKTGAPNTLSVLGSPSAQGCPTPPVGTDQSGIVILQPLSPLVSGIYTLPFTVAAYNSTVGGTRRVLITFGGQVFTIKQTSW